MNELGARLQALRRQANLSQQELAERLHVSRQSISKWELGTAKPDLDNMIRLSELFGVSLDELVLGKTQNKQEIPQHSAQPVENAKAKQRKRMRLCLLAGVLCLVLAVALLPRCIRCSTSICGETGIRASGGICRRCRTMSCCLPEPDFWLPRIGTNIKFIQQRRSSIDKLRLSRVQ